MGRLKTVLNKPIEPNNGVVPRKEGLWFAAGVAGQNISCGLVGGWFYYFCTDVAYYDMRVIAFVLTFARIWDAVNDPLMGVLIDRHRFKNGEKLRPWLKLTPFIVGSVLNVIPLLFIRYPDSLKQQVEADLKARRAESAAQAHSAAQETTADA